MRSGHLRHLLRTLTVALLGTTSSSVRSFAQTSCPVGEWSPPRALWHASNDSASMHPNDADSDSTQLIVVSQVARRTYDDSTPPDPAIALGLRLDFATGRVSELRRTILPMSYEGLRVKIDRAGVGHLFWREIAGKTVHDTAGGEGSTQIWTLRVIGDSVTAPERILAARDVTWDSYQARAGIGVDEWGRLHLILVNRGTATQHPFVHLVRDDGRWSTTRPSSGRTFMPLQLTSTISPRALHVAFTGLELSGTDNHFGSIYYREFSFDTMRWSDVRTVFEASDIPGASPVVNATPSGEVRVFWKEEFDARARFDARKLRLAVSRDGASFVVRDTWLSPAHIVGAPEAWTDACNATTLHLVTAQIPFGSSVRPVTWREDTWHAAPVLQHPFEFLTNSRLTTGTPGRLTRVWSSGLEGAYLPTLLIWYESHRSVVMPTR